MGFSVPSRFVARKSSSEAKPGDRIGDTMGDIMGRSWGYYGDIIDGIYIYIYIIYIYTYI